MSAGSKLNRKQEAVIAALLTEPTHAAAAAKAGVGEATLQRWLLVLAFQAAYRLARRSVVEAAIGRLQQATGLAVEALERNLTCGHTGSEIRAALGILDHSIKAVEWIDLTTRMEEMERLIAEQSEHGLDASEKTPEGPGRRGREQKAA